jgi:predicted secreted protein
VLKLGRDFLLLVNDGLSYARVEAQRSTSVAITSDAVDSTTKGDNWRDILQGAGINSAQVALSGVASNSPMCMLLLSKKIAREHIDCRIDDTVGAFLVGTFKIVSIAASGTHNGEETYDITLESSNAVTASGGGVPIGCDGATNTAVFAEYSEQPIAYRYVVNGDVLASQADLIDYGIDLTIVDGIATFVYFGIGYAQMANIIIDAPPVEIGVDNTNPTAYADAPNFGCCFYGGGV